MGTVYLKRGSVYSQTESNFEVFPQLEKGVYDLNYNGETHQYFLKKLSDEFNLNFKLYGLDEKLISHVLTTYNDNPTKKNIGILLNGIRGGGKTVTAKVIANRLNLPVIVISAQFPGLDGFITSIKQDCIFFLDEFEKNFGGRTNAFDENEGGESLLSVMDGVYNSEHCHIFLLTTNNLRINENFLSRPSRIRYLKSFDEVMEYDVLEEIVDDFLIHKDRKKDVLDYIMTLEYITIDIVKTIIEEVNIHNCPVSDFKDFFNTKQKEIKIHVFESIIDITEDRTPEVSIDEFLKDCNSYYTPGTELRSRPRFRTYTVHRRIGDINVGDEWINGYDVIHVDKEHEVVVTNYGHHSVIYHKIDSEIQTSNYTKPDNPKSKWTF